MSTEIQKVNCDVPNRGAETGTREAIRREIDELNKKPCQCVFCGSCGGSGNIAVNYDGLGRIESFGAHDDSFDLEPCEECHSGITETCQRCQEIEELE